MSTKPFVITSSDVDFILQQVEFPTIKLLGYGADGAPRYGYIDAGGTAHYIVAGQDPLTFDLGYYSAVDPSGIRNVSGLFNNLTNASTMAWGSAYETFLRLVPPDGSHYLQPIANGYWASKLGGTPAPESTNYSDTTAAIVDYTPRMISQTIASSYADDGVHSLSGFESAIAQGMTDQEDYTFTDALTGTQHTETFIRDVNSVALDPSLSGWNTLFGQFFDHGLDFIQKPGTNLTITIPLAVDDPMYDPAHGVTKFVITRATPTTPGGNDYVNTDSPYIDQNQTYGANEQIRDLLREWTPVLDSNGNPTAAFQAGAALFDGHHSVAYHSDYFNDAGANLTTRTLPTLNELRAYMDVTGRGGANALTWEDISDYRLRDTSGHLMDTDATAAGVQTKGSGQAIVLDMNPRFDKAHLVDNSVDAGQANADLATLGLSFDANGQLVGGFGALAAYINFADFSIKSSLTTAQHDAMSRLLMSSIGDHYIAGDGRANENFGLTALHHVFHEDHNIQLINLEQSILKQTDLVSRHGWQQNTGHTDADGNYVTGGANIAGHATIDQIAWDPNKLFEATKLIVEMEYQHVAIDQYARRITPDLPEFVTYDSSINADISLEYAQAAFRFGHSQLRETIDALDPNGSVNGLIQHYLLKDAFLTPSLFASVGAGAIAEGMSRQVSNEIDEFLTPALQQTLLGQSLDLAAINIARGRDVNLPTLNETRQALYDALVAERADPTFGAGSPHAAIQLDLLRPYNSWNEFAAGMAHPESLLNFIAAYSFDGDRGHAQAILDAELNGSATYVDKNGVTQNVNGLDAAQFLAGARNADGSFAQAGADGFNKIDLWIGGLAEGHVIGGALGPTFNAIFEDQMERLMDGDRFYYLYRLNFGLANVTDLNAAVTTEQFKDIIERTTGAYHLNGDVMSHADDYVELGQTPNAAATQVLNYDGTVRYNAPESAANSHKYGALLNSLQAQLTDASGRYGVYSTSGRGVGANGTVIAIQNPEDHTTHNFILDQRPDSPVTSLNGNPTYGYDSHEVIGGTAYNDYIDTGDGDDTAYGEGGNDVLIGNGGGDHLYGGDGADTLFGGGGTAGADVEDFMDGGAGDDVMYGGQNNGAVEVMIGGDGNDRIYGESGIEEINADNGDDFVDAGSDTDLAYGGYGNDYLFGGEGPDELHGQAGDDIVDGGTGSDKLLGEQGDDILLGGVGQGTKNGDSDELTGDVGFDLAAYWTDLGTLDVAANLNNQSQTAAPGATPFTPYNQLWTGIEGVIGTKFDDQFTAAANTSSRGAGLIGDGVGNWLVGGAGNDILQGNGGNDVIIGDSIRLDALVGRYESAPGVADTYSSDVDGASHHAAKTSTLTQGLLGKQGFDKHFTDLLASAAYKDFVLGDNTGEGTKDVAVFSGKMSEYTGWNGPITYTYTDSSGATRTITAYQIHDKVAGRDGDDLVVGIEKLRFADGDVTLGVQGGPTDIRWRGVTASDSSLPSGSTVIANLASTDPNVANATFTYQLLNDTYDGLGITAPRFTVSSAGQVRTASGKALQPGHNYTLTVSSTDSAGAYQETFALITGSTAAQTLTAGDQYDTIIYALGGNDVVNGGAKDDTLFGQSGNDTMSGGGGHDSLAGGSGNDVLSGGEGNDTLDGASGGDVLNGGNGNDSLSGGSDNDTLTGGAGDDTMDGGSGTDLAIFAQSASSSTFSGLTVLTVVFAGVNGVEGSDQLISVEQTQFTEGVFNIVTTSLLNANPTGGNGRDLIVGDDRANRITGGGSADFLVGNGGADTFVFASASDANGDIIRDFVSTAANATTHDKIDLSGIDANTAQSGNQAFIFDSAEHDVHNVDRGHLGYDYVTDANGIQHTYLFGNTSSNAPGHDFEIDLIGHVVFTTTGANSALDLIL